MTGHACNCRDCVPPTYWWATEDPVTLQHVQFSVPEPEFYPDDLGLPFMVRPRGCFITVGSETVTLTTSKDSRHTALRAIFLSDHKTLKRVEIHCAVPPAGNWREMAST